MCLIENKSASTILPIISKHVRAGSKIFTDEAKVYQALKKNKEYEHNSIVHKYQFVDYEENVHTQNIESFNNKIKLRIKKMKGVNKDSRKDFLLEFMWLDFWKSECFSETLKLIK